MTTDTLTKKCTVCNAEKPITEFYRVSYAKHRTYSLCINCMKIAANKANKPRRKTTNDLLVQKLNDLGIFSFLGTRPMFSHIDVVAWGCVRIEVKASNLGKGGYYHFSLTPKQGQLGLLADIVVFICNPYLEDESFHVFDARDPVLYLNGSLKKGISWTPNANSKIAARHNPLTDEIMNRAQNNWQLIEDARLSMSQSIAV